MKEIIRLGRIAAFAAIAMAALRAGGAHADDRAEFQKFLKEKSPSIVTVKYLLKMSMGGDDHNSESEIPGVMIDPKGIILCSNTQLGGVVSMMARMMPAEMGGGLTARPTDIKVLVGEDSEGVEAKLLARDTELDLAWIQVKEPGDKKFEALDLAKAATPEIGDRLMWVWRLGKHFDRASVVGDGRVSGTVKKPRELYVPSGVEGYGVPVFAMSGELVGVTVSQAPSADEAGGDPMGMMGAMFGMAESMAALVLPAADIAKATARAMEGGGKEEEAAEAEAKEKEKEESGKPGEITIEKEKKAEK